MAPFREHASPGQADGGRGAPCFVDVFAGCGGLSLGMLQAGWKGLFAVEKDPFAFATLQHNLLSGKSPLRFQWPEWLPIGACSLQRLQLEFLPSLRRLAGTVDAVVGGPPCQGFSSAGRRRVSDPRNLLVESYLDFVETLDPKLVLIENVRGITVAFSGVDGSDDSINYAAVIKNRLSKSYVVDHEMINTSTLGVPQRRERFFLVGVRKDIAKITEAASPFALLPQARDIILHAKGIGKVPISSRAAISDLEVKRNGVAKSRDASGFLEIAYSSPRTAYQRALNGGRNSISDTRLARHSDIIVERFQKVIENAYAQQRLNTAWSTALRESFGSRKRALRVLDPGSPSPTITSMPDDLLHYSEPRTLTVRENARIQSFPDWFEFKGKYTTGGHRRRIEVPRFTQVANAVPPLVAEIFGKALRMHLARSGCLE